MISFIIGVLMAGLLLLGVAHIELRKRLMHMKAVLEAQLVCIETLNEWACETEDRLTDDGK